MRTTHHVPGLVLTDHTFRVPLDHARPDAETIEVFAREVVSPARAGDKLPWLVFFQGGPGAAAPRPMGKDGWLKRALQDYRVLLLDQRGTGRSTPVTAQTLARFESPQAMADYLKHFRADAIVRDAEHIRRQLLGEQERWSVLGQSFGGFCVTSYLSLAPQGLRDGEIFWVVSNGIRMTGMPAFSPTHKEDEIWKIVAFVRHLPEITKEEQQLLKAGTEEAAHHHEAGWAVEKPGEKEAPPGKTRSTVAPQALCDPDRRG